MAHGNGRKGESIAMSKQLSFYALLGLIALVAVLYYHVIQPFVVALFIAIALAVLVEPIFAHLARLPLSNRQAAAAVTTLATLTLFILPVGSVLLMASNQLASTGKEVVKWFDQLDGDNLAKTLDEMDRNVIGESLASGYRSLSGDQREKVKQAIYRLSNGLANDVYEKTRGMVGDLFDAAVGFAVMGLGLYYFLADGRTFMRELHRLMPFERTEEEQLFDQFQRVCRGVVLGTVVAGVAQATLAGLAFSILQINHLWILIVLTMVCSFIPFVGSVAVWAPVAASLFLNDQYAEAIGLSLFGLLVISTVDNLVRAYVIGGEAKLHPFVALVSVLGALKLVGLWGVFVGPMVAAFFYALAQILRHRIVESRKQSKELTMFIPH